MQHFCKTSVFSDPAKLPSSMLEHHVPPDSSSGLEHINLWNYIFYYHYFFFFFRKSGISQNYRGNHVTDFIVCFGEYIVNLDYA